MSVRKGYIYALLLALGLFLWSNCVSAWEARDHVEEKAAPAASISSVTPWTSAEAVYECSMKAQELGLTLTDMHVASDTKQGSMVIMGERQALQDFYSWLENEGALRAILSLDLEIDDETVSQLIVSFQL